MAARPATASGHLSISSLPRRVGLDALVALLIFGAGLAVGLRAGGGNEQGGERHPDTIAARPDPGPSRVVNGVPLGYARTEAGALAAATAFLRVSGSSLVTDDERYSAALETMAAPEWRARARETSGNATRFALTRYGPESTVVTTPVTFRMVSFSPDVASVEVWAVMTATGPELERAEQSWITARLQLRWTSDDWRLSSEDTSSGPAPSLLAGDETGDPGALLDGFEPYE